VTPVPDPSTTRIRWGDGPPCLAAAAEAAPPGLRGAGWVLLAVLSMAVTYILLVVTGRW